MYLGIRAVALLWALCCTNAFAAAIGLTIHDASAPAGATVRVPVDIALNGSDPATLLLRINYDDALLTPAGLNAGPAANGKLLEDFAENGAWTIVVYGTDNSSLSDGMLLEMIFSVAATGANQTAALGDDDSTASDADAEPIDIAVAGGDIAITPGVGFHSADTTRNWRLSLGEMVRVAQLYNSGGYACNAASDDGFLPGPGDESCTPHGSDYSPQDWAISADEMARLVALYIANAYSIDALGPDGFAPGPF